MNRPAGSAAGRFSTLRLSGELSQFPSLLIPCPVGIGIQSRPGFIDFALGLEIVAVGGLLHRRFSAQDGLIFYRAAPWASKETVYSGPRAAFRAISHVMALARVA